MSSSGTIRTGAWALSVGVVLADSSIVTLALPEVLREYDTSVFGVSWVLTAYNVFLAALIIPAAGLARRRPERVWGGGLLLFAAASLACALSGSIATLIAARCAQAIGGAAVLAGAIELLARARGSHRAAAGIWAAAGTAGLVLGPAVGGVLTEAFSWQSIFILQVPLAALALAARRPERPAESGPQGQPDRRPEVALGLLSAGLTAALFLLVVLLTEGWGLSPLAAALVVSVMPVAAVAASRIPIGDLGLGSPALETPRASGPRRRSPRATAESSSESCSSPRCSASRSAPSTTPGAMPPVRCCSMRRSPSRPRSRPPPGLPGQSTTRTGPSPTSVRPLPRSARARMSREPWPPWRRVSTINSSALRPMRSAGPSSGRRCSRRSP
jgi:hypothetical protein